jgi:hypothetical protein
MGYEEITNYVLSTVFLPSNEQFFTVQNGKRKGQVNFQAIITSFLLVNKI